MAQGMLVARSGWRRGRVGLLLVALLIVTFMTAAQSPATKQGQPAPVASGWNLVKYPQGQPACAGLGSIGSVYYDRMDCGFGYVGVSETVLTSSIVKVSFIDSSGVLRGTQTTTPRTADNAWPFTVQPGTNWAPGTVTIRVTQVDPDGVGPAAEPGRQLRRDDLHPQPARGLGRRRAGPVQPPARRSRLRVLPTRSTRSRRSRHRRRRNVAATFCFAPCCPTATCGPYGPFTADCRATSARPCRPFRHRRPDRRREHELRDRHQRRGGAGLLQGSAHGLLGGQPRRRGALS